MKQGAEVGHTVGDAGTPVSVLEVFSGNSREAWTRLHWSSVYLINLVREFGFYLETNGDLLKGLKQGRQPLGVWLFNR